MSSTSSDLAGAATILLKDVAHSFSRVAATMGRTAALVSAARQKAAGKPGAAALAMPPALARLAAARG